MRTVLVTGSAGPAGRALMEQLAGRNLEIVGADMAPADVGGGTTLRVPAASDPAFLGALRRIVSEHAVDVVIPTVSEELPILALAAESLGRGVEVVIGEAAPVALAHDKLLTAWSLRARGVPVPRFGQPGDFTGIDDAFEALGSPFIAKPRVSRGGRGVVVVRTPDDVAWTALDDSWILQEFASGIEYAPVVHRSSTGHPDLVAVLEKTGLAGGEVGNATGVRRVGGHAVADVSAAAYGAVAALGLTGPVDVDVRRLRSGTPVVLEVNARFGANSRAVPELLDLVLDGRARGRAAA